jgi:uncharacterized protein
MPRPRKRCCVQSKPGAHYFKPRGIPLIDLEEISLRLDELEAVRLADFEGLYHVEGAGKMGVSRATFGRILGAARRKIAEAVLQGKALKIETTHPAKGESHESMFPRSGVRRNGQPGA